MPGVAVWFIEAGFFEFFDHYFALHIERSFVDAEGQHSVAFEPKCRFEVLGWHYFVECGVVIGGVGVVFPPGALKRIIKIGSVFASSKH